MGNLLLVLRLVRGDMKRRWAQAAAMVVVIAATTTTLALGLALRGVSANPFARTRAATDGPDVVAMYGVWRFPHPPGAFPGSLAQFDALSHAQGVAAASGPYPLVFPQLSARGYSVRVFAEGRDAEAAAVDRPLLTSGQWVRPGGVVLERAFADALGVNVGQSVRLDGLLFRVVGVALTTSQSSYPEGFGVVWLTRADVRRLARGGLAGYALNLKLADPATAPAFAAAHAAPLSSRNAWQAWSLQSWQSIRAGDLKGNQAQEAVLLTASWLLAMLATAMIAVLVGARMAEQTRRVGLLKAIGGTPALIAVVLLAENLVVALAATLIGIAAGRWLAPVLTRPSNGLLGAANSPSLTLASAGLAALAAVAVVAVATVLPAVRGARMSTLNALRDPADAPERSERLIAFSRRLPVPLMLGVRLVGRRLRRAALTALSLAIGVAPIAITLIMRRNIDLQNALGGATRGGRPPATYLGYYVGHVLPPLTVVMIVLAAICTIITTWATVIDAQRATAITRALGATPRQIAAALAASQALPALIAALVGIPLGLVLYLLAHHGGHIHPPTLDLLAIIPGTLAAVAALTALPAGIAARRSVSEVLRSE